MLFGTVLTIVLLLVGIAWPIYRKHQIIAHPKEKGCKVISAETPRSAQWLSGYFGAENIRTALAPTVGIIDRVGSLTDEDLECIRRLPELKGLALSGKSVTPAAIAGLKAALRKCDISGP